MESISLIDLAEEKLTQARQVTAEIQEAERTQLLPWTATVKRSYVRVFPSEISGRRFRFGSEPDRD